MKVCKECGSLVLNFIRLGIHCSGTESGDTNFVFFPPIHAQEKIIENVRSQELYRIAFRQIETQRSVHNIPRDVRRTHCK